MLRAIFNRQELVNALNLIALVAPKRSPKPILSSVRIESMDGIVKIGATDLELAILLDFHTVQIERDGLAVINLRSLLATLKASTSHVVKLESHTGGSGPVWRIADDDTESTIAMDNAGDYPPMPGRPSGAEAAGSFTVNRNYLSQAISYVAWSATRTGYAGGHAYDSICFSVKDGRLWLVATDARTMAVADLGAAGETSFAVKELAGEGEFVLPVRLGKLLTAAGKYAEEDGDDWLASFVIRPSESAKGDRGGSLTARFAIGDVTIYCTIANISERQFPPYRDVLTGLDQRQIITAPSEEFLAAVRRCALVTNEYTTAVALDVDAKGVCLSAGTHEGRATKVNFPCRVVGNPIRFGMNPDQLIAAIKAGKSDEFTLAGSAHNRPWLISNGNGYKAVIMPVNLNDPEPAAAQAQPAQPEPVAAPVPAAA
jgi:DNA polymerase III subunit beta